MIFKKYSKTKNQNFFILLKILFLYNIGEMTEHDMKKAIKKFLKFGDVDI